MCFSSQLSIVFVWKLFPPEWLYKHSCVSALWLRQEEFALRAVLVHFVKPSRLCLGAPSALLHFAIPAAAVVWREAGVFDFISAENLQERLFLSKCPYGRRIMSGAVSLVNLNPGTKPSVKPCCIPAIWTNLKVRADNPTRQLPLDKTLPLCNKIRGRA